MAQSIADQKTRVELKKKFPHLSTRDAFGIASPYDEFYNCIAFAAGITVVQWWPVGESQAGDVYWPAEAPNEQTIEAFEVAFATLGYEPCPNGEFEDGYEKVAIYAKHGVPKHATRQDSETGRWLSKIGDHVDIWHEHADSLEGDHYGDICDYMKRRVQSG